MKSHNYAFCPECGNKLAGDEFLCPGCGFKLAERPPVEQAPVTPPPVAPPPVTPPPVAPPPVTPPPVQQQTPTFVPPTPPVQHTPQAQPITYQPIQQEQYVPKKKKRIGLWIFLILLIVILVGGGVGAFLISNGTISRDQVSFIPESILDKLAPEKAEAAPVKAVEKQVFYLAYSTAYVNGKKIAIISSVMIPPIPSKASEKVAKNSFMDFAQIKYKKDYFKFKNSLIVKKFDSQAAAMKAKDDQIKKLKNQGYELRLLEVQYSEK